MAATATGAENAAGSASGQARPTAAPKSAVQVLQATGNETHFEITSRVPSSAMCDGHATAYFDAGQPQALHRSGITMDRGKISWDIHPDRGTPIATVWTLSCTAPDPSKSDGVWRGEAQLGSPPATPEHTPSHPATAAPSHPVTATPTPTSRPGSPSA